MKLIHCADLHLDSGMETGLPAEKARERRLELLDTFENMIQAGASAGAEGVLLCGDLFDGGTVSARARSRVLNAIREHPDMTFYYLRGNHDREELLAGEGQRPENLRTFGPEWTTCEQNGICVTGAELSAENADVLVESLRLDPDRINIVMLHGMAGEYGGGEEGISLRKLRGKHIDYLALGHVHSFRKERLDDRGIWCYSGCLEGRGFDECGEKGYVMLEVDGGRITADFVPCAARTLHEVKADVSGLVQEQEILAAVRDAVKGIPQRDLVKAILTGSVGPECEIDVEWLMKKLEKDYYFLKLQDRTRVEADPEDYRCDVSLRGEFVRLALASELDGADRGEVLRLGLRALAGEE
ncbi:MAG: metallophosphoesterase [Eubacteriales bacterium]|nr:metallophosphoesterase [Eubacteriales bacterium]